MPQTLINTMFCNKYQCLFCFASFKLLLILSENYCINSSDYSIIVLHNYIFEDYLWTRRKKQDLLS